MAERYDVIILGCGAMGSAAAYQLARRGRRVLGLERFAPGHDRGSSHGGSRIIRQAYFEGAEYVPLVLRAYELWREAERALGEPLLTVTGGVNVGPAECRTVRGSLASAREHGLRYELLDATELRRRWPVMHPAPDDVAVVETEAGFVRPERAVEGYCRLAAAAGAEIRTGERVDAWRALDDGGVEVRAGYSTYTADRLVVTAGAWAPELLADLGLPLTVERQVMYWFGVTDPGYAPDRFPVYVWEFADGLQLYGFPDIEGRGPKVGIFRGGAPTTADAVDRTVHEEEVARARAALAGPLPAMAAAPLTQAKTCLYTTTPDEDFVIDVHPRHPQVVVAAGFSGHGFKFASVVGEVLADLATDGTTRHDVGLFRLSRFGERVAAG